MSVGSGTDGGLEGMTVSDCLFDGTTSGIRIKNNRGRGGLVENCVYSDLTMTNVQHPIYIVDYYPERTAPKDPATETNAPVTERTPMFKNIAIRNLSATNCPTAGLIYGLPEAPVSGFTFENVHISAVKGLTIYQAKDFKFTSSSIRVKEGKALILYKAEVRGMGED